MNNKNRGWRQDELMKKLKTITDFDFLSNLNRLK